MLSIILTVFVIAGWTLMASASPEATPLVTTVDSDGDVGQYSALAVREDGVPVIGYLDDTTDDLLVAICGDVFCNSPTLRTVESAGSVGRDVSLALTQEGYPVISHYVQFSGDLHLAICEDLTCSSVTHQTVASEGNVGTFTSLALKDGDIPVISYFDEGTSIWNSRFATMPLAQTPS